MKKSLLLSRILDKTCQLQKEQFAFSRRKRDTFLLCAFLVEEGDIIVFSHRAVSAEERLYTSSSTTTASWAKERNSLSALPAAKNKLHTPSNSIFLIIIIGQELTKPQIINKLLLVECTTESTYVL